MTGKHAEGRPAKGGSSPWLWVALVLVALALAVLAASVEKGVRTVTVTVESRGPEGVVPETLGPESENGPGSCGKERWAVKTLTDPAAKQITRTALGTTIDGMVRMTVPDAMAHHDPPRQPEEQRLYTVTGNVLGAKAEADSDIHLALIDPTGAQATMIVEFPALTCTKGAQRRAQIERARKAYVAAYGEPSRSRIDHTITGCVTVTGVAFFDRIHGQFGVAPNGIELHPVLSFKQGC